MPNRLENDYSGTFPAELLDKLALFTEKLISWNKKFSFTAVEDSKIFDNLIAPSAWLGMQYTKENIGLVADFGTGPGIPGIPMALADPNNRYLLVDSNERKTGFVKHCLTNKMLFENLNVETEVIRVEPGIWTRKVGRVVTRATGDMAELIPLWKGKVSQDGKFEFFKGEEAMAEVETFAEENGELEVEILETPDWFGNLKVVRVNNAFK